jgi:alpha-L-fucosidase
MTGSSWFSTAGLGLFVHWDHASQQGIEISLPMLGRWLWPERLDALTTWMAAHGESVLGVQPGPSTVQFYGPVTRRADTMYMHLVQRPVGQVVVRGLPVKRIKRVRLLATGQPLPYRINVEVPNGKVPDEPTGELFVDFDGHTDALVDVIAVDLHPAASPV